MKLVDLDKPTSFLDHECLGCSQLDCKVNENDIDQYREMFESLQQRNYQDERNLTQRRLRGPTTWKDMFKKAL